MHLLYLFKIYESNLLYQICESKFKFSFILQRGIDIKLKNN